MIHKVSPLSEAELRLDARRLYHQLGYPNCLQVLYEVMIGARIIAEIFAEELRNDKQSSKELPSE